MRYFEKQAKEKRIDINKDVILPSTAIVAGSGYAGKKLYDFSTQKVTLNPKSNRVAVFYPGGSSGSGHKVPAKEFIRQLSDKGFLVDVYDTNTYQGALARKIITPMYLNTVAKDPVTAMPTQTSVDPDVRLGKNLPLWRELKELKEGKRSITQKGFLKEVQTELWNAVAGHNKAEKEFRLKGNRDGGYRRVFSFFGPTADIIKNTGAPVEVVTTDYITNPLIWNTSSAGRFFVPNKASKKRFTDIDVPKEKIIVTGDLITSRSFKNPEKYFKDMPEDMKAIKAANPKARFVTVTGGGTGINVDQLSRQISRYYEKKDPNVHIFAMTGENKDLFSQLKKLQTAGEMSNVTIKDYAPFGNYLYHSDFSIIRPGGSTTAEIQHLGKPFVTASQHLRPKKSTRLGAHEHGNILTGLKSGGGLHFQTKYDIDKAPGNILRYIQGSRKPGIINIKELDRTLDIMENEYPKLKVNAEETAKLRRAYDPIQRIIESAVPEQRPSSIKLLDKFKLGAGLVGAGIGAYYLNKALNERDKRKNIIKQSEVTKEDVLKYGVPAAAGAIGVGSLAGHYIPGLRGGKGPLLGSLVATKRVFYDMPAGFLTGGFLGKKAPEAIFNVGSIERLKLTPTEIRARGLAQGKSELAVTSDMLREQEAVARAKGVHKMVGVSHFTPAQAARFGYRESESMRPEAVRFIFGKKPLGYYPKLKTEALNKLVENGIKSLDATDAYFLSANPKHLRLFEKDLRIPEEESKKLSMEYFKKFPKEKLDEINIQEKTFKKRYDDLLKGIYQ